jgi:tetratricopeptide (TPR) repeat protein
MAQSKSPGNHPQGFKILLADPQAARYSSALMPLRKEYRTFLWLVLCIAATYVVYVRTLGFGFTNWDDAWLVSHNPVMGSFTIESLKTIWLDLSPETRRVLGAEYLPVRDTFTLGVRHFLGWYPVVHHATSLALYLITVTLFFVFLLNFSADLPAVTTATLLFSLHPSHVETVAWISETKSLLSLFFLLIALLALLARARLTDAPLWKRFPLFLLSTLFFSLSILSKSTAIVFLPLVLALGLTGAWDSVPRKLRWGTWLLFAVQTLLHLGLTMSLGKEMGMYRPWMGENLFHHFLTVPTLLSKYIGLLVFPWKVEILTQISPVRTLLDPRLGVALLVLVPLAFFLVRTRRKGNRLPTVGILWFILALLPVLQLTPFVVRFASRFLFLPSAAIAFLWIGLARIDLAPRKRNAIGFLGAVSILFFGLRSNDLVPRWKNCETLWSSVAREGMQRNVFTANRYHCYLGREKYADALRIMNDAIAAEPGRKEYWVDAGRARLLLWDATGAEVSFARARDLGLPLEAYWNNLGVIRMHQGRLKEAERLFRRVISASPENASAWNNLGKLAWIDRRKKEAIRCYRRAVSEDPSSPAWNQLIRLTGRWGTPSDLAELEAMRRERSAFPRGGRRPTSPDFG